MISRYIYLVIAVNLIFSLYPSSTAAVITPETIKEELVGKTWYENKNYYLLNEDGTYQHQIRLRPRNVLTYSHGKYRILENKVYFTGPRKFKWIISAISPDEFSTVTVKYGSKLPEEGVTVPEKNLKLLLLDVVGKVR